MTNIRSASAALVGAAMLLGTAGLASVASAADIPIKAAPKATPWVLDVHGYADYTYATNRVTGGGMILYPSSSSLSQIDTGLRLDIYKNQAGLINSFSVFGGVWNEYWTNPPVGTRQWQEMDWWLGFTVGFAKYWSVTAQRLDFQFPGGGGQTNYVVTLGFNDSFTGWPIVFNPYLTYWANPSGGTNIVTGAHAYRIELGMKPTIGLFKGTALPLTLVFPTWIELGPKSYWDRADGTTNRCGTLGTAPCSTNSVGYVSTGIQARWSLETYIPKRLGSWYVKAGAQYYHFNNDILLANQVLLGSATSFNTAHRDYVVGSGGVGFSF
jgi:hypothetical protein